MKEYSKIFKLEVDFIFGSIKIIDIGKEFISENDASVYLRMNKELVNGEYIVLKLYKKENGTTI